MPSCSPATPDDAPRGAESLASVLATPVTVPWPSEIAALRGEDHAAYMLTSGSTGPPAVVRTYANIAANIAQALQTIGTAAVGAAPRWTGCPGITCPARSADAHARCGRHAVHRRRQAGARSDVAGIAAQPARGSRQLLRERAARLSAAGRSTRSGRGSASHVLPRSARAAVRRRGSPQPIYERLQRLAVERSGNGSC